jgi:hypothetical protein
VEAAARGDPALAAGCYVVTSRVAAAGGRAGVNLRASAILTASTDAGPRSSAPVAFEGPGVRARGDALLIRVADGGGAFADGAMPSVDCGMTEFEERWGIFQYVAVAGAAAGTTTIMPRTEANEAALGEYMRDMLAGR